MSRTPQRVDWGQLALDFVFIGGALGILLTSVAIAPAELPAIPLCQFRHLTGLPCAGCGMTRSFCAIGHGEFRVAWDNNPFGFLFFALTIALLFWPFIRREWPAVEKRIVLSPWFVRTAILLIGLMWVFGVARTVGELSAL